MTDLPSLVRAHLTQVGITSPFADLPALQTTADQARIAQIDLMFEGATGWGAWMVSAANEREQLANKLGVPHKWLARTGSGGRTS